MLTSAIVSGDETSSAQLKACLEQSGMVSSVKEWNLGKFPDATEEIPDFVLLDISRDPEPLFVISERLRRVRPDMRLIAASLDSQPTISCLSKPCAVAYKIFFPSQSTWPSCRKH